MNLKETKKECPERWAETKEYQRTQKSVSRREAKVNYVQELMKSQVRALEQIGKNQITVGETDGHLNTVRQTNNLHYNLKSLCNSF